MTASSLHTGEPCLARRCGHICTRTRGHEGDHQAGIDFEDGRATRLGRVWRNTGSRSRATTAPTREEPTMSDTLPAFEVTVPEDGSSDRPRVRLAAADDDRPVIRVNGVLYLTPDNAERLADVLVSASKAARS